MDDTNALLITVTGQDRPGIAARLCATLADRGARILDIEQTAIHGRLLLGLLVSCGQDETATRVALTETADELGVGLEFETVPGRPRDESERHHVVVLGQPLPSGSLAAVSASLAQCGANIDRIVRLSRYPIMSVELQVAGGDGAQLRDALAATAAGERIDVAVQEASLYRRAKRLIVMDVDSTLVQGEVIEELAALVDQREAVARVTERAMTGELDFEASLRERVALLEGVDASALETVRDQLRLTPGARTVTRTLKRLGFELAIVSGGFTQVTDQLVTELGLDYSRANTLEIVDGRLTGRLVGPIIDRAAKARALEDFASSAGVPISQTVAVGDGANDLGMLGRAGLGIAFNAKPVVAAAADTRVSVPYLDAILSILGIARDEVEAADAQDGPGSHGGPTLATATAATATR
ncbi:phosphoserine phosphatase SerB [Egibacter rhizosphaerae]|uniref:phosphoserine phosphatase n=1 Tax=Egibacter rhizosphaerae TaxID=1670831 RepID=A0A411YAN0_9ACTN|nr:phosphoserine phosphatase SerB [Egibacter rhizosphaerae]QBI18255.1 phosphoserine phosphatase SerB [Egibacter rhizosphaerae]